MSRGLSLARDNIKKGDAVFLSVRDLVFADLPVSLQKKNEIPGTVTQVNVESEERPLGPTLSDQYDEQWDLLRGRLSIPTDVRGPLLPVKNSTLTAHPLTTYDVHLDGTATTIHGLSRLKVHRKLSWDFKLEAAKAKAEAEAEEAELEEEED